jgi:glycyl-tRNA synthetase beta chain
VPEFTLEIGCEEIPSAWFASPVDLRGNLRSSTALLLEQERIQGSPKGVGVYSTPRRLVVRADVLPKQEDRSVTAWGPPLSAARDPSGEWTKAARGFAAKLGVAPEALEARPKDPQKPAELYLAYERVEPGRPSKDILPGVIAALLRRLPFPKKMSWDAWLEDGRGSLLFGRPIRWIVALLDGERIPFSIYAQSGEGRGDVLLESAGMSRGHRFLPRGSGPFAVRTFSELEEGLRERFVILDPEVRLQRIRESLVPLGPEAGTHPLVAEWAELVEYPTVVVGRIPSEFRALPAEVLETVLVHHQRYIPLTPEGPVPSRFAAVTNTDGAVSSAIVRGMERVVVARLRDAAFFFAEDMKRPLAERVSDLAGVTFHQGLGTYLEKTLRMVRLVDAMGAEMGILTKPEHDAAREAAQLSKADLTTLMVREFPELQGAMGGIYLKAQGTPWENVIRAVRFQYHPLSLEEGSPPARFLMGSDATVFGAVSLADKLDTLAGYFGLALEPTGSSDPFGLRRAAQGVVRVLLDFWDADVAEKRPDLERLIAAAVSGYGSRLKRPAPQTIESLHRFFLDRLEYVLEARGFPPEEVAAVLLSPSVPPLRDPYDGLVRLKALHVVRGAAKDDFAHLAVAFKRAKNILNQGEARPVETSLFEEDAERELHKAVVKLGGLNGSYEERLRALSGLRAPVDRFFDKVLVMAEDADVRANRLGLLKEALSLFYRIADISKLGG